MNDVYIFSTLVLSLLPAAICWWRTRDPLHPAMLLGAMFAYMYFLRPFLLGDSILDYAGGRLTAKQVDLGLLVNLMGVGLFGMGLCWGSKLPNRRSVSISLSTNDRMRLYQLGVILGVLAVVAYWITVFNSGGFVRIYSKSKGYVRSPSGYLSEAVTLSFPAIILLFLARRHLAIRQRDIVLALFFASPHLLHGILGARRGPTFLVLATLLFSWFGAAGRKIKLPQLFGSVGLIVALMFVLITYRGQIYIGSEVEISSSPIFERAFPTTVRDGDDYEFGVATINVAHSLGKHYYGSRLLTTLLVRPVPKQLWRTKYEDVGFGWMESGVLMGYTDTEWRSVLGWRPSSGSSGGFAADLFVEFGWGQCAASFLFGFAYCWLWRKAALEGGLWVVLFLEALILVVYVPTQTVSAVLHRYAFMSAMTVLFWKLSVGTTGQQVPVRNTPAAQNSPVRGPAQPRMTNSHLAKHRSATDKRQIPRPRM